MQYQGKCENVSGGGKSAISILPGLLEPVALAVLLPVVALVVDIFECGDQLMIFKLLVK